MKNSISNSLYFTAFLWLMFWLLLEIVITLAFLILGDTNVRDIYEGFLFSGKFFFWAAPPVTLIILAIFIELIKSKK